MLWFRSHRLTLPRLHNILCLWLLWFLSFIKLNYYLLSVQFFICISKKIMTLHVLSRKQLDFYIHKLEAHLRQAEGLRRSLRASEASARAKRAALKRSVPISNWSHAEGPYMYPSQSEQLPKYIG